MFWLAHWLALAFVMIAILQAHIDSSLDLPVISAVVIAASSLFIIIAPHLVLRHDRQFYAVLQTLEARLAPIEWAAVVANSNRLARSRRALVPIPVGLVWTVLLSSPTYFAQTLGLGRLPDGRALLALVVFGLGGLAAGYAIAAVLRFLTLCWLIAALPDAWNPFTERAGENAEALSSIATRSSLSFSLGGATLLPGVVAVGAGIEGGGLIAIVGIAILIGCGSLALLIVPAWRIHQGSSADKDRYLQELADRIRPLAEALTSESRPELGGLVNDQYRLTALLDIYRLVVAQPSSPASIELLRQSPLTLAAPTLAVVASLL